MKAFLLRYNFSIQSGFWLHIRWHFSLLPLTCCFFTWLHIRACAFPSWLLMIWPMMHSRRTNPSRWTTWDGEYLLRWWTSSEAELGEHKRSIICATSLWVTKLDPVVGKGWSHHSHACHTSWTSFMFFQPTPFYFAILFGICHFQANSRWTTALNYT